MIFSYRIVFSIAVIFLVTSLTVAVPLHIYIVAGQSNAVGIGNNAFLQFLRPGLEVPQTDIWAYGHGQMNAAKDLWMYLPPDFGGDFGPELTFARDMADFWPDQNTAIYKCAWGGTNLHTQWKAPDANGDGAGPLYVEFMDTYANAIAALDPNLEPVVMGMIWMQGESDAFVPYHVMYEQNLTDFINSLRLDLGVPSMPFVIGKISDTAKDGDGGLLWDEAATIRQAQQDVADAMFNVEAIETNDLPLWPYNTDPYDPKSQAHYDTNGLIDMGSRFAEAMCDIMGLFVLTGPNDGDYVDANGAVLSCEDINDAVSYQLLFGQTAQTVNFLVSDTNEPPTANITAFPLPQTYWTIKVTLGTGYAYFAVPRLLNAAVTYDLVKNINTSQTYIQIQSAVDDASSGNTIVVGKGTFNENIDFLGKAITLRSLDPDDADCVAGTIICGSGSSSTVSFKNGEDSTSIIDGITVTGAGIGIECDNAEPTIKNCRVISCGDIGIDMEYSIPPGIGYPVVKNCVVADNASYGIYASVAMGDIINCTIVNNGGIGIGDGIMNFCDVKNCILYGNNGGTSQSDQISVNTSASTLGYNCIQGWTGGYSGEGNFSSDPCFADANGGDYHLKSEAGRYCPLSNESDFDHDGSIDLADLSELTSCWLGDCINRDLDYSGVVNMLDLSGFASAYSDPVFDGYWTRDAVTSACIDAGDPADSYSQESVPNGSRINVGAYGDTTQAARTP